MTLPLALFRKKGKQAINSSRGNSGLDLRLIELILERGHIYEVGGVVRDSLLKRPVTQKDKDFLVTGVPYEELSKILRNFGRVDLVGKSFGIVKFTPRDQKITYDVALPRKEFSTGVAHRDFQVDFDYALPIEEDLKRRDFTINAMAKDLATGEIIDPLGGRDDLDRKILRMTSPKAFAEDPLRMLRGIQFAARFEFEIEPLTFRAMKENSRLISSVSPERIQEELNKLLQQADRPSLGFWVMKETGILEEILPELAVCVGVTQPGGYHKFDIFEHTLFTIDYAPKELRLRLAALFHDICKPQCRELVPEGATFYGHERKGAGVAKRVMTRLRYPNQLTFEVVLLVRRHMYTDRVTEKGLRRLIRNVGEDLIFDLLELRRADVKAQGRGKTGKDVDRFKRRIQEELERKPPLSVSDLEIDGHDVMGLCKIPPSPMVGKILNHLLNMVLDDPEFNQREKLIEETFSFYNRERKKNESEGKP
jgi:putative nucleotidyltransferase with HDIG domain